MSRLIRSWNFEMCFPMQTLVFYLFWAVIGSKRTYIYIYISLCYNYPNLIIVFKDTFVRSEFTNNITKIFPVLFIFHFRQNSYLSEIQQMLALVTKTQLVACVGNETILLKGLKTLSLCGSDKLSRQQINWSIS